MRQTEEITVNVRLSADEQAFQEFADSYTKLAQKVNSEGSEELFKTFLEFSESLKRFLETLSLKLDDSSTTTTN